MTQNAPTNLSASVRQRLINLSKTRGEAFDLVLARFAIERLLYRLTKSAYADNFLLKGAMLFAVWADEIHRPTRDVDLLGFGSTESADILKIFRTVCAIPVTPDGINFSDTSVQVEPIREEARYGGVRVQLEARLAGARIPVQVDIGFGDAVTPEPETITFPALLDFAAPVLRAYPIYSVVAEKTEAMVALGEVNTRMKDFFDLGFLAARYEFDGMLLFEALQATFKRRVTPWPVDLPVSLQEEFSSDRERGIRWRAFLRKSGLTEIGFPSVMTDVREFIGPALAATDAQQLAGRRWIPGQGWQ
jgi:hypothetical protein